MVFYERTELLDEVIVWAMFIHIHVPVLFAFWHASLYLYFAILLSNSYNSLSSFHCCRLLYKACDMTLDIRMQYTWNDQDAVYLLHLRRFQWYENHHLTLKVMLIDTVMTPRYEHTMIHVQWVDTASSIAASYQRRYKNGTSSSLV